MSLDSLQAVLGRAMLEPEFRALLLRDPAQALAGYDLTAAERESLHGMSLETFDSAAADLEPRLSKLSILQLAPIQAPPQETVSRVPRDSAGDQPSS
jgi:hypothetical protein